MRKLAIVCTAFSAAVFAANYIFPAAWLPFLAVLPAAAGLGLLAMRRKWLRGIVLALLAFGAGSFCFMLHVQRTTLPAKALDGQTRTVTGRLLEFPQVYDDYCRVRLLVTDEDLPRLEALVYDDSQSLSEAGPGRTVRFTAKITAADTRYGQDYDSYHSRDIYLVLSARSQAETIEDGFRLSAVPARIGRWIARQIERAFPADTAPFMKSLMLGDKSDLYEDEGLYLALGRAGLLHIVAVSGMHIAYLVSLLQLLLGRGRKSSLLCIALVWLFVLTTGAVPSAVRAGVMQSMLLFAPVVDRENDAPTSLSFALALLLLKNPYAAASVSLQLSFAAMAGLYCLSDRLYGALLRALPEGARRRLRYLVGVAASSVSVMAFVLPLTAVHFGSVALFSPLANLLAVWAVPLCFCGGYAVCALAAMFLPLGAAAAWLVSWLARYICLVARLISAIPFAAVYMQSAFAPWWLALCYGLFLIGALSRAGLAFKLLLPAALSAAVLALNLGILQTEYASAAGVISVLDVGQGQCINVFSGKQTFLIDCGGIESPDHAGETAGAYLLSRGRTHVDALLLTHLHADHANGVTTLLEMVDVERIFLPTNPNDEDGLYEPIRQSAQAHDTELCYVGEDQTLRIGGITACLFAPSETGGMNERCVTARVTVADHDMLVTADAPKSVERELVENHDLTGTELLIVGHHGSRYSSSGELLRAAGADTAVISVGYNRFGHPTYETLARLTAYGYTVYRTDLNGTVEFRIG